jgi:anti-sigma28 factor (negative regulator of flagellin synthesis)
MKVIASQEIGPRTPLNSARATSAGSSSSASSLDGTLATDTVDSSVAAVMSSVRSTAQTVHSNRVDTIASQLKQGTYVWPTSQQIADRILDDAELTARLQAMFQS